MKLTIDAELRVDVSKLQTWIPAEGQLALRIHPRYSVCHISADLSKSAADRTLKQKSTGAPKAAQSWRCQPSVFATLVQRIKLSVCSWLFKQVIWWRTTAGILHPTAGFAFQSHRVKQESHFDINIHKALGPMQLIVHLCVCCFEAPKPSNSRGAAGNSC